MNILAVIPSRYASTRFPGKPLALVKGIPMVVRVYNRAKEVFQNVCVATDDERILKIVEQNGGCAIMTKTTHKSGTDRCLEAMQKYSQQTNKDFDIVINIQGDEPFISTLQLQKLAQCFEDKNVDIATIVKRAKESTEVEDFNRPKVVIDKNNFALYFSRSIIPHPRQLFGNKELLTDDFICKNDYFLHVGLYGYRSETLEKICCMEESFLERIEKLEQLRWLENGLKIKVAECNEDSYCIDTPEDLDKINGLSIK